MKINNYGATGGASPIPYEYSYNSSQPHINCKHQTCPMNVPSVLPNVANRQHYTCLAPTLPKPHYPLLCTIALASLVKGEVLSPEKIRATTGGIASPPSLSPHQPFQNRTIPLAFRTAIVCVCLYGLHLNYPTHFS